MPAMRDGTPNAFDAEGNRAGSNRIGDFAYQAAILLAVLALLWTF